MDQETLREWEHRCIQEEPPECTAACPIHLDARLFIKEMSLGNREAAFKVLVKSMPFPGILGRICDHPCESHCKRGEAGEPIAIGLLEQQCVKQSTGRPRVQPLPSREQKIAVIGSGLAGLTTAWDLLKKGFRVTLFEKSDRLGGSLRRYPETILPQTVIREELAVLETLKADIRLNEPVDQAVFDALYAEFDALFIDREAAAGFDLPLKRNSTGEIAVDAASGATDREGVFAGGGTGSYGAYSPVNETLQGRKGALSIERFIQKANMEAGRENEGAFPSKLFTNLSNITPLPRIRPTDNEDGYSDQEAHAEAARCIQCACLECVKVCHYLERYQGYPKKYARQVFNNERVIYGAAHTKNLFINSCTACGLCETVCPNDFNMGELCLQARRTMNEQKVMPLSFHEFALQDMAHSLGESFALSRHEAGAEQSAWLYFPSCQLCATSPGEVLSSYRYLREHLDGGVGIMLGCCGAPAHWAGRADLFGESMETIRRMWKEMGKPRVITACSSCQHFFTEHGGGMETVSLWKVLEETGLPSLTGAITGATVMVADPCITRHDRETQDCVRRIVQSIGFSVKEFSSNGEKSECCGYGGLVYNANPGLAKDLIARRVATENEQGDEHDYLAYCAMCRDNFAATGKRTSHLIEHLFPAMAGADPAARGWISWSQRRVNRTKVKQSILLELGETGEDGMQTGEDILIEMNHDVRRRIDERRILEDDVRMVINHAEQTGRKLKNNQNGYYRACHQLENVTFWVDYTPGDSCYTVHNAYCHRMTIVGIKK
jgi:Fe-S oxidoreductase